VPSTATYNPPLSRREKLSIFALAAAVLAAAIGSAFAAGWVIGRILL
jgi:hypothetical protein